MTGKIKEKLGERVRYTILSKNVGKWQKRRPNFKTIFKKIAIKVKYKYCIQNMGRKEKLGKDEAELKKKTFFLNSNTR